LFKIIRDEDTDKYSDSFAPSSTFSGAKKGFIFTSGINGLGYYPDKMYQEPLHVSLNQQQERQNVDLSSGDDSIKKKKIAPRPPPGPPPLSAFEN
jgi:hypothetical protein